MAEDDEDSRTIFCGNLHENVTDAILYELFLQGGPVAKVSIPKDKDGRQRNFGFVTFVHTVSVPYCLQLFSGTALFNQEISIKARNSNNSMNSGNNRNNYNSNQISPLMGQQPSHNLLNNLIPPRSNYSNRHNNSNSGIESLDPEILMALSNQLLPSIMNLPQNSNMNQNDNYKQSRNNRQHKQNRPYQKNSPPRNNRNDRNDRGGNNRRERYDSGNNSGNGNRNR